MAFAASPVLAADSPATAPATQPAPVVVVQPDGSLLLNADGALILGYKLRLQLKPEPVIVHWVDVKESLEWPKAVSKKGSYEVEITYSCAPGAGGGFTVSAGASKVHGQAQPTADWQTFKTVKLGKLTVLNDNTSVMLHGKDWIPHALLNLRSLRLIPVADDGKGDKN